MELTIGFPLDQSILLPLDCKVQYISKETLELWEDAEGATSLDVEMLLFQGYGVHCGEITD